ncbi:hypothetical protein IWZ00DRAFT_485606 [Phyllosticta capitalensis]
MSRDSTHQVEFVTHCRSGRNSDEPPLICTDNEDTVLEEETLPKGFELDQDDLPAADSGEEEAFSVNDEPLNEVLCTKISQLIKERRHRQLLLAVWTAGQQFIGTSDELAEYLDATVTQWGREIRRKTIWGQKCDEIATDKFLELHRKGVSSNIYEAVLALGAHFEGDPKDLPALIAKVEKEETERERRELGELSGLW